MAIIVEDNQQEAAKNAGRMGWSAVWDWREHKNMTRLANAIADLWNDTGKLQSMHNKLIFDMNRLRVPDLASHVDRFIREHQS